MVVVSGSANSLSDLRDALMAACVTAGWSQPASEILALGGVYVRLFIANNSLQVQGGTGVSGSSLTGAAPGVGRLGKPWTTQTITFPVSYTIFIHDEPDEVYLIVNGEVDLYFWLAFGQGTVDLPGSAAWFGGSFAGFNVNTGIQLTANTGGGLTSGSNRNMPAAPWWQTNGSAWVNTFIHHDLDGRGWGTAQCGRSFPDYNSGVAVACEPAAPRIGRMPNPWNQDAILIPIQPYVTRPSNFLSLVADLAHARFTRVDNYEPGQVIQLGDDYWQVFPFYRKNAAERNGGNGITHTGTFGWAIRTEAP